MVPDGVGVVPKFGTVNVAHQEAILEANALQCIQKKLDAVVKVGLLGCKGWGIGSDAHAPVDWIPSEVGFGAWEAEAHSHLDRIDGVCVKDGLASRLDGLCDSCREGVAKVFGGIPEVHLCSLLGGGKASLLGFGVAKDLALEDLHVEGTCSVHFK